jgi:hypothetical protein
MYTEALILLAAKLYCCFHSRAVFGSLRIRSEEEENAQIILKNSTKFICLKGFLSSLAAANGS